MRVIDLVNNNNFEVIVEGNYDAEISDVYASDLLSWVMSHGEENQAYVTIMNNVNVIAVASLLEFSCVIYAEGVKPDETSIEKAKQENITLLSTSMNIAKSCSWLDNSLK